MADQLERHTMGDPVPAALGLFAFALFLYGVRYVDVTPATLRSGPITVGLDYALLITAIGQLIGGVLALVRGLAYQAYITIIFGLWLLGFYWIVTDGAREQTFTPDAVAWYSLALLVPVFILAAPAVKLRLWAFMVAFAAIIGLLLLVFIGFHSMQNRLVNAAATKSAPDLSGVATMIKASAYCAFVAAASIWFSFAYGVFSATGVVRRGSRPVAV